MRLMQKLASNTAYLFLDWIAVTVLSFLFWVFVWKTLPPEFAGTISTSVNLILLISTFGMFGIHGALQKLVPEMAAKRKKDAITALIRFSNRLLLLVNLAIAAGFLFLVFYVGVDVKIPVEAVLIVAAGIVIWPMVNSTTSVLLGFQNMKRIFTTDTVSGLTKLVVAGIAIYTGLGYIGPLFAVLMAYLTIIILRRDLIKIGSKAKAAVDRVLVVRKYALSGFIASSSWSIFSNTPTIILAFLDSLRSSGIFSAALNIANPIAYLPNIVSTALFPIASALSATRNSAKRQAHLFSMVIRYIFLLSLPILITFFFFAKAVVLVLARPDYMDAVQFIPIMGVAVMLQAVGNVFLSNLYAIGRPEMMRNISILTSLIFLVAAIPATSAYGIHGLIAGYMISVFVLVVVGYAALKRSINFYIPWGPIGKVMLASVAMSLIVGAPHFAGIRTLESVPFLLVGLAAYVWMLARLRFFTYDDLLTAKTVEKKAGNLGRLIRPVREFLERSLR